MGTKLSLVTVVAAISLMAGSSPKLIGQTPSLPPGWNDNSQPSSPPSQNRSEVLTLHAGVQLVLQDITVTDTAGHSVTGLKPEDFHISEDGRPQTIKSFEEHAPVDPTLAERRAAELAHSLPSGSFTNYKAFSSDTVVVFLIDTLDITECAQLFLHEYLTDYMKTQPAGTPYIIFQLDTGLHMVQDLTTDRDALRAWVRGKRDFPEIQNQLGPEDPRYPSWAAALRRRQIVSAVTKELDRYLGAIPGRKDLIWFGSLAGGLTMIDATTAPPPATHASVDPRDPAGLIYKNPTTDPLLFAGVEGAEMKKNSTVAQYLQGMTNSLAQSRVVMNTIAISCPFYQYGVSEHIAALVDRSSHYYTISYSPTNQNWNGQPRKFSAEMANPTLHLDYRHSYLGNLNDSVVLRNQPPVETAAAAAVLRDAAGPSPTLQTAMGMGTVEPTQVVFEASATPASVETKDSGNQPASAGNFLNVKLRKQGYRDYVVHFRVRANELKLTPAAEAASYTGKLEFVAVVYDNQGQAVNGKWEKASVSFPSPDDSQLQTASLTGDLTIQVPVKGSYFLRLGVRDTATDRVGALEIPVDRIPIPRK